MYVTTQLNNTQHKYTTHNDNTVYTALAPQQADGYIDIPQNK